MSYPCAPETCIVILVNKLSYIIYILQAGFRYGVIFGPNFAIVFLAVWTDICFTFQYINFFAITTWYVAHMR